LNHERLFKFSRFTFWRMVRKYVAASGIPAHLAHPHVLKHSIAMQLIDSAGIENTRQYLGHKNLSSTGAYLKVSDADAARAAGAALGARQLD
jgi:site-specific recombinase XerD